MGQQKEVLRTDSSRPRAALPRWGDPRVPVPGGKTGGDRFAHNHH
jgi:hypothetical protein